MKGERDAILRRLTRIAKAAQARAYAPYSRFRVGAAIRAASGTVYAGCNVENASYGLSICAERSVVAQAVAAGERRFTHLAIVSDGATAATPCGMCRQTLAEFCDELPIRVWSRSAGAVDLDLKELLPFAFDGRALRGRRQRRKK